MKQIHLLIIFFAAYHFSSFSSEHQLDPALKTMINKTLITEREYAKTNDLEMIKYLIMIERENIKSNHKKTIEYNSQLPKISQEKVDKWVAEKEREIKENQARYKEQQEVRWFLKYNRKKMHQRSPYLKTIKKKLQNDHRNRYNPQIKTIECYPTRLLLEWKK